MSAERAPWRFSERVEYTAARFRERVGRTALRWPALALLLAASCNGSAHSGAASIAASGSEPIVGLPCEGCEAVFQGLPAEIGTSARIAPADEPGEALRMEGTVRDQRGQPVEDVIVYAYHTNARGIYPPDERFPGTEAYRHGRLRGWVRTDARGRYRFDTIRPASYPDSTNPAHVHMHVIEPGRCTYWIDDLLFDDDPFLNERERSHNQGRGGSGIAHPARAADGTWLATRDIELGREVPEYPAR